ncbi:hypothetical protein [Micromonospora sp. NPDC049282]|uniref:hypothetical protein n=1 Tax=Micromonospora sp. NPDC049282 TaxID=3364269 RepID=UPI003715935A
MSDDRDATGTMRFIFEAGVLKRAARTGWWFAGVKDPSRSPNAQDEVRPTPRRRCTHRPTDGMAEPTRVVMEEVADCPCAGAQASRHPDLSM